MVCTGKNIVNGSKNPQFLLVMCALCPCCARDVHTRPRFVGFGPNRAVCVVCRNLSVHASSTLPLNNSLSNMHSVPIGAWDIGFIPVRAMATQPRFQGTSIGGIGIMCFLGVRCNLHKFIILVQHKWGIVSPTRGATPQAWESVPLAQWATPKAWESVCPTRRATPKAWESVSPTREATPKAWESVFPTQGATPKRGSVEV